MLVRFFIYGLLGWAAEILWTGLPKKRSVDWTLAGHTQWWTFPIYGQMATLYEPLHDRIRHYPWYVRGVLYAFGFVGVEFATGELIRSLTGQVPWDYTGRTRWHVRGSARLDYLPGWFLFGLVFEPIHDYLVRITPALTGDGRRPPNEFDG